MSSTVGLFVALAGCCYAAYYGLMVVSGQNKVLDLAAEVCASGRVRTEYSGFPAVDNLLCILIVFLEGAGSAGPSAQIYDSLFLPLFAVPIVISHLEASRPQAPFLIKLSPFITSVAAQLVGAGLAYPVWFALYTLLGVKIGTAQAGQTKIRTLFPAILIGLFLPAVLLTDPLKTFNRDQKHVFNFLFQVFPLTVAVLKSFIPSILFTPSHDSAAKSQASTLSTFGSLTSVFYWSSLFNVYKAAQATNTSYLNVILGMFRYPLHPTTFADICHVFLLFDGIILFAATYLFVAFAPGPRRQMSVVVIMTMLIPLVGPAAALFWGWARRTAQDGVEVKTKTN